MISRSSIIERRREPRQALSMLFIAVLLLCATLFVGCAESEVKPRIGDPNIEPTQVSYDLISTDSKNGNLTYRMVTPLMEHYELADEPFTEFTRGIKVETFNDSTMVVQSDLRADYAHYDEKKQLWEVRGNVVANNYVGDKALFTEQLFWDEKIDLIYSDKAVRVIDGNNVHLGVGFKTDGEFNAYSFRQTRGLMEFKPDSVAKDSPLVPLTDSAEPAAPAAPTAPIAPIAPAAPTTLTAPAGPTAPVALNRDEMLTIVESPDVANDDEARQLKKYDDSELVMVKMDHPF